jgi:hypothetical protein
MEIEMKKLMATLILTTAVAAPAFAQTAVYPQATFVDWRTSPNSVYNEGMYRGTDPDPQVRFDLRRESPRGGN